MIDKHELWEFLKEDEDKVYYATFCEPGSLNTLFIDTSTAYFSDSQKGHKNHNIVFYSYIQNLVFEYTIIYKTYAYIAFPANSFKNMLLKSGRTPQDIYKWFSSGDKYFLKFVRENKKRYKLLDLQKSESSVFN